MKKTIILLTMMGISSLSASTTNVQKEQTNRVINILIKHDFLVEREVPKAREVPKTREARENRVVRMGKNSRGIRPERMVRMVYEAPKKKEAHLSATSLIQKNYFSKLSK